MHTGDASRSPERHVPEISDGTADAPDAKRVKVEPTAAAGCADGSSGVTHLDGNQARADATASDQPPSSFVLVPLSSTSPSTLTSTRHSPSPSPSRSHPLPLPLSHPEPSLRVQTFPLRASTSTPTPASDHSPSPVPTPTASASTSTATSPERKLPKDKARLHKAAVDRKRSKDKPRKKSDKDKDRDRKDRKRQKNQDGKSAADSDGSDDDDAHCICKGANKEDETFIGCEICDGWFHPGCMKIDEESVEMLDVYVCPPCETATGRTTAYKRMCKREGCERTAKAASKYCSSKCAFQNAQAMVAAVDKKDLGALETSLAGYPSPTPTAVVETHSKDVAANGTSALHDATAALIASLQAQSEDVLRLAELVAQRQALFAQAIEQWDALKPVTSSDPVPAPKRKSKNKRRDGETAVERPCGWDSRLLWSDEEVRAWDGKGPAKGGDGDVDMEDGGEGEGVSSRKLPPTMCQAGRRCDRHQGWQKTLGVALDVEAAQLSRKKDELEAMMERIRRLEEVEAAGSKARAELHARLQKGDA